MARQVIDITAAAIMPPLPSRVLIDIRHSVASMPPAEGRIISGRGHSRAADGFSLRGHWLFRMIFAILRSRVSLFCATARRSRSPPRFTASDVVDYRYLTQQGIAWRQPPISQAPARLSPRKLAKEPAPLLALSPHIPMPLSCCMMRG